MKVVHQKCKYYLHTHSPTHLYMHRAHGRLTCVAMDQALAVSQVELRTAQETRKADLEQMREAKERMSRLEAEAKNLRNEGIRQRHETEGVAANAGRASLEVEISRLSEMLDGERERAERLESALNQARDEARILLRQRQAHFSAVAQVIAMTLA